MVVKVIGKLHREGNSKKTGKPYSMNSIFYNCRARGVEGLAAKEAVVDPAFASYESILVGGSYSLEFDERGYMVAFDPVKG